MSRTRILVADDEYLTRIYLTHMLADWGYEPVEAADGDAAWSILAGDNRPPVALLDWSMPGTEGPEICRRLQGLPRPVPLVLMVTGKTEASDLALALQSGASDFVSKPFNDLVLQARIAAAVRTATAERDLVQRIAELEDALKQNRTLRGLIPIFRWCKAIRTDEDYWQSVEAYLTQETGKRLTHGACPRCMETMLAELEKLVPPTQPQSLGEQDPPGS